MIKESRQSSDLANVLDRCRSSVLDILNLAKYGHSGGSLSVLDILVALYFRIANIDPNRPDWPDRDRIVLSKAHVVEAMYAVLAERGFFSKEDLKKYLEFGSMLQGHVEKSTPGVEFSGGSLGQGLSFSCGLALAGKLRNSKYRVFCVLGDAECHEGQVWEAAMFAPHYELDNLTAIVDYNHYGDHNNVNELMNLEPLLDKWRDFGWDVSYQQHGNDVNAIIADLDRQKNNRGKPYCLIANTIKNNGVPRWQDKHVHLVSGDELEAGLAEARRIWGNN